MTFALIAGLLFTIAMFAWLLDRRDDRAATDRACVLDRLAHEQDQHRHQVAELIEARKVEVAELVGVIAAEREHRREEIQVLLQRIQAPEVAIVRHDVDQATQDTPPQPPNTDAEYWELSEEHQREIARLEALENAQFDRA